MRLLPVIVLSVLTASCGKPEAHNAATASATQQVRVVTAKVTRQLVAMEIEAVGTAMANESVEITAKAANKIADIRFQEGQRVRRGAVLIVLDGTQLQAQLAGAEATLAESLARAERSRTLAATQALSKAELDQIEATLKSNRAAVATARANLADSVIRAPFDGRTGFRQVSVGSFINPGDIITTLDDASLIKLDFTVPQSFLHALRPGLTIQARVAGLPGQTFDGTVAIVGSRFDPVTRSVTVRAHVPNERGVLKPGMFMAVALQAEPAAALVIPEGALVPEQGKTYVFAVVNDVVTQREVTTGRRQPGILEVTTGLKEGDIVVVEGTQNVREGTPVIQVASNAASEPPADAGGSSSTPGTGERVSTN